MSLKITISGYTGEGKTTLAVEIAKLLRTMNMNASVKDFDIDNGSHTEDVHTNCVKVMGGRGVIIETIQLQRNK